MWVIEDGLGWGGTYDGHEKLESVHAGHGKTPLL